MNESDGSITEQRDLRTGTSLWTALRTPSIATRVLEAPGKADVVIVGAGITGALVAEAATARGLSVFLLDRRPPFHGSTAASTALLQYEIDTPFVQLANDVGFESARRIWQRSYRAVVDLGRLVGMLAISCHFRPRRALYLAGKYPRCGRPCRGRTGKACRRPSFSVPNRRRPARSCRHHAGGGVTLGRGGRRQSCAAHQRPSPSSNGARRPGLLADRTRGDRAHT
jgi:hypothetical protein